MDNEQARTACVWVAGTIARLAACGVVDGYPFKVTPKGMAIYDQVNATGYRPSVMEIANAMGALGCINAKTLQYVCLMAIDESELLKSVEAWELEDIEAKEQA